jgi:hypothetical protein
MMRDRHGNRCGRDLYDTPQQEGGARCIIHSLRQDKDPEEVRRFVRREVWDDHQGQKVWDDFSHGVFPPNLILDSTTFPRPVYFDDARFLGVASFIGTTFESDAFFRRAAFRGRAHFVGSKFRAQVSFEECVFDDCLWLSQSKLSGPVYLFRARVAREASFRMAILENIVLIDETAIGTEGGAEKGLDVSEARIRSGGGFHLVQVNQAVNPLRLRAANCLLTGSRFEAVNWDRTHGRLTLADELAAREDGSPSYELVKIAYDRLTALFDATRSYDLAEESFVGAMEMARNNPHTSLFHRATLTAYRFASLYGTSYSRPLWLLLVLWLFFTFAYAATGLVPTSERQPQRPPVESSFWDRFVAGGLHSAQVSLLTRDREYATTRRLGTVLTTLQPVPMAVTTAFLLLAIRRRFHRGH